MEDRNPLRKSIGQTRRYSSSQKSTTSEERDTVPNYLRASTGSCHDFCKYGKKDEHLKPRSPLIPKRSVIVNKEKITKTVAVADRKKTIASVEPIEGIRRLSSLDSKKVEVSKRRLLTSRKVTANVPKMPQKKPLIMNPASTRQASAGSNGGTNKKDVKTVKKSNATPEPSVSFKSRNCRIVNPSSLLTGQDRMPQTNANKRSNAKNVQVRVLHVVKTENKDKHEEELEQGSSPTPFSLKSFQDSSDNDHKGRMVISEGKEDDDAGKLKFVNGPTRLKFRKKDEDNDELTDDCKKGSECVVVLKHQIVEGKKECKGLLNNVIEETASKLVKSRKSKVKALVGAFESVISLQDVNKPLSSSSSL